MPFLPSMASYRNQDAQLRRDLDQDAPTSTNSPAPKSVARYRSRSTLQLDSRSFPLRPSTSSVHSGTDCTCGVTNSTKAVCRGTAPCGRHTPLQIVPRHMQLPRGSINPFLPIATSTAADQSSVGIRAFPYDWFSILRNALSCFFKADDGGFASRHGSSSSPENLENSEEPTLNSYRLEYFIRFAENSREDEQTARERIRSQFFPGIAVPRESMPLPPVPMASTAQTQ